jgi:hypothetical protein
MRNFRIYLDDIIDAMEKIESFTAGLSFKDPPPNTNSGSPSKAPGLFISALSAQFS